MANDNPWAVVSTAPAPDSATAGTSTPSNSKGDSPWSVVSTAQAPDAGGDGVLANHPMLQKLDRGLQDGVAAGFGLTPNTDHTLSVNDAMSQTWANLKKSAIQSYHNLGGRDQDLAGNQSLGHTLLSGAAVVGTPFDMIGTGINGMATGIEDASKDLLDGLKSGDHEKTGRGAGKLLASIGQLAVGMEGSAATDMIGKTADVAGKIAGKGGDIVEAVGKGVEKDGSRAANGLVRAKSLRSFGKNLDKSPGQTIIDEKIKPTNDLDNLQQQVKDAQTNLASQVRQVLSDPAVAARTIDPVSIVDQKLADAKSALVKEKGLVNRANVLKALNDVRDDIVSEHDADGNVIGMPTGPRTLVEANELKRSIGRNTRWNSDPEIGTYVNDFKKSAYGGINDAIENEVQAAKGPNAPLVQSVKALNKRYSNAIEFERLLKNRIAAEGSNDVGFANMIKHGEFWGGITSLLGGAATGNPIAMTTGAGLLADRAMRSPAGRIIRARGESAVGKGLQSAGSATADASRSAGNAASNAVRSTGNTTAAQGVAIAGSSAAAPKSQDLIRIRASDGGLHDLPRNSLGAAHKRDPGLKIVTPSGEESLSDSSQNGQPTHVFRNGKIEKVDR